MNKNYSSRVKVVLKRFILKWWGMTLLHSTIWSSKSLRKIWMQSKNFIVSFIIWIHSFGENCFGTQNYCSWLTRIWWTAIIVWNLFWVFCFPNQKVHGIRLLLWYTLQHMVVFVLVSFRFVHWKSPKTKNKWHPIIFLS